MRSFAAVCLISAVAYAETNPFRRVSKERPCRVAPTVRPEPLIKKPLEWLSAEDLPKQKLWNDVDGTNYLTTVKNQHIPQYCGSCWAQAASSSLSDRIKIARNAAWPEINIAEQVLISCETFGPDDDKDSGCHGGYAYNAFKWMAENEITDETCSIYRARGYDNGEVCSSMNRGCRNCNPGEACYIPDQYMVYGVDEYGECIGEEAMKQELQRGPIACGIAVPDALETYTGGIFCDDTGDMDIVHDVSVVGYGEDDSGSPYWLVRNSWGHHWGEGGFFRVCRGTNNINIESDCSWATPKDTWTTPVWHQTTQAEKDDPLNDTTVYEFPQPEYDPSVNATATPDFLAKQTGGCRVPEAHFTNGEKKHTPYSWELLGAEDVAPVDWRNKDGVNYLSWNKNQHIPQYCGSCWAQGSTSAIADRFNIMNGMTGKETSPVGLNAQVIVNCQAGGSCDGGDPAKVYEWANTTGLKHASCMNYIALNLEDRMCEDIDVCRDCVGPPPAVGESGIENCTAVDDTSYYVSEYFKVKGADQMKAEL